MTHTDVTATAACSTTRGWAATGLLLLALAALTGCPDTGVVCRAGTTRCGSGCSDFSADRRNCGGCGVACAEGQDCVASACTCREGTSTCSGACVVLSYDVQNCGACGHACAATEVCETSQCKVSCTAGVTVRCGSSCIDTSADVGNCGACGAACNSGQSCRGGRCTYDFVAACFSTGQLAPFKATEVRGPHTDFGSGPAALAAYGGVVLSADGVDRRLYQAGMVTTASGPTLAQLGRANVTGSVPNQVLVDAPYVYVVNAESGTLQVLMRGAAVDSGVIIDDGGAAGALDLATVAELPLGPNTYPEGMAKVADRLWIPLYGGFGAGAADAGQRVLRVSVTDPMNPVVVDEVDLHGIDLRAFDGGSPVARPFAAIVHRGAVYVALNNLNPSSYAPEGPGLLARIDPSSKQVTVIDLGAAECLNPQWLASDGTRLAVSCGGQADYSGPNFSLVRISSAGLVLLDQNDHRTATWAPSCPADAGVLSDGGLSCPPMQPGRFAFSGGRVYLADQNAGRLYVLDIVDGGIGERRGYFGDAGAPLDVCTPSAVTGLGNVSDVVALP